MILEIDMGNTRIKWRLRSRLTRLASGYLSESDRFDELLKVIGAQLESVERVLVASVRSADDELAFCKWVQHNLGVEAEFARSSMTCGKVTNGYLDYAQLGVDRWLAILAGYNQVRDACLIVSMGTAMTADLVLQNGQHLGGYIAPGIHLFNVSLSQSTARIGLHNNEQCPPDLVPGRKTSEAITHACGAMVKGVIDNALQQISVVGLRENVALLVTGGDADWVRKLYPWAEYKQELVLDGLEYLFDTPVDHIKGGLKCD